VAAVATSTAEVRPTSVGTTGPEVRAGLGRGCPCRRPRRPPERRRPVCGLKRKTEKGTGGGDGGIGGGKKETGTSAAEASLTSWIESLGNRDERSRSPADFMD